MGQEHRVVERYELLRHVGLVLEYVETGETYGQIWKKLSHAERGPWLRKRGYKVLATRERAVVLDATGAEIFEYTSHHRAAVHYLEADAWRDL